MQRMMMRLGVAGGLAATLIGLTLAGNDVRETGAVGGVVRDLHGAPVGDALIVICDAESGLPLGAESRRPFVDSQGDGGGSTFDDWWFANTDEAGGFRFDEVPKGRYHLVAQSFPDVAKPAKPLDVNGLVVVLRGVVEDIEVVADTTTNTEVRPMGDGAFVYHRGAGNDHWYTFLSAGAPAADPVLGPLGRQGGFLQRAIGYCRMPAGQAIVRGLPATEIHYTLFANDSNPGFGAGNFHRRPGKLVVSDTGVVASWSDGLHEPPARLQALCDEVQGLIETDGVEVIESLLARGREETEATRPKARGFSRLFAAVERFGPLDRVITLDFGTQANVADLMAATAYSMLRR